ncbi:MAG: formate dehydrogenase accessory sulfurtransferase FdhD [Bacteroidia bacterium]|nr:formate dehydrogenase accessory sulfurtransferase FdhD [Bacteroidia bacterium]
MKSTSVHPIQIQRVKGGQSEAVPDLLAVEEPMEIQIWYGPESGRRKMNLSVTMRTPGHDFELAVGFLYGEGIIQSAEDVQDVRYCLDVKSEEEEGNVVVVRLEPWVEFDGEALQRNFYANSSCGVCGKASIEALQMSSCPVLQSGFPRVNADFILGLSESMQQQQTVFKHTGGIHAAVLFDLAGKPLLIREDIGRHNAVDKLIGASLYAGKVPLSEGVLWVSGRAGFELVQKAVRAGIPIMASVGAASSLAVDTAAASGMTLIGFLRQDRFNIYCGAERIGG